ncbi:MAG: GtrA family protein [Clostridium sp.]|nr:GtrA family protein [Clostridium sp.]
MIKKLFLKYKEPISYIFFGVLTTIVSLASFKAFDMLLGKKLYLITNIFSWLLAVIFAYITNKLWVFESKSWKAGVVGRELISFFGARVFSLIIEEAGLWLMIDACHMGNINWNILSFGVNGNMLAKLIMQIVVVILNYIFSKLVIFKKQKDDDIHKNSSKN